MVGNSSQATFDGVVPNTPHLPLWRHRGSILALASTRHAHHHIMEHLGTPWFTLTIKGAPEPALVTFGTMITPVDPNAFGLVWHAVVRQILDLVRTKKLAPGQRLPSIPDLAREFGVATKTVQRALAWLTDQGVVARFPGRGTFIVQRLPRPLPQPPDAEQ